MKMKVEILVGDKEKLGRFEKDIKKITIETMKKINKKISVDNVVFIFKNLPKLCIPGLGHGAITLNKYIIFIRLNVNFLDFKNKVINEEIKRTVAHEIMHLIRMRIFGRQYRLIEIILEEGLCDHFDYEINGYNLEPLPWQIQIKENEVQKYLNKIKKDLYKSDMITYRKIMFDGDKKRNLPKWLGYSLGFYLIKKYLEITNKKPSQIYKKPDKEIIISLKRFYKF